MLAGYFDGIPRELDEAAKVDGCGPMRALIRVILPAARPGTGGRGHLQLHDQLG